MNVPHTRPQANIFAALSAMSIIAFALLALAVVKYKVLAGETDILAWVHAQASPMLDQFFVMITHIGDATVVIAVALLLAGYFAYKKQRQKTYVVLLLVGGSILLNVAFKLLFHRARPELWEHLVFETGFSFPSGHAMLSVGLLASIVITTWHQRGRWLVLCFAVAAALLVGLSRLYLGVHYPSDIIAGWMATLSLTCAVLAVYAKTSRKGIYGQHS